MVKVKNRGKINIWLDRIRHLTKKLKAYLKE